MVESLKLFVRTYVYWVGLILGFAMVPGSLLFTAEVAPVNTPLWLAPFASLVLLIVNPPRRWPQPRVKALWIRLLSSVAATLLLVVTNSFYRSTLTHEIFVGDWQENLVFFMGAWVLYAAVAGATYLTPGPSHEAYDKPSR